MSRRLLGAVIAFSASIAATTIESRPVAAQSGAHSETIANPYQATMDRLSINLPQHVAKSGMVQRGLDELTRERCDKEAIARLGTALQNAGYRREAANAHVAFSESCGGHVASLRAASNILLNLSDYKAVAHVTGEIIKAEPHNDNGYFLRAVAHDRGGNPRKAIDDYTSAIELFPNKQLIASVSYFAIARLYAQLGQHCDATGPLDAWVAANPTRNDNSQTRAMIADYRSKGTCKDQGRVEVFPRSPTNDVARIQVSVNGVTGTFVLDTGATLVSLRRTFATKANIRIDEDSTLQLYTANGVTQGKRGQASSMQVRSLKASEVPLVVQADDKGSYGPGIDGLLGMSFLSRFNLTIDAKSIKLSSQHAPSAAAATPSRAPEASQAPAATPPAAAPRPPVAAPRPRPQPAEKPPFQSPF